MKNAVVWQLTGKGVIQQPIKSMILVLELPETHDKTSNH